ncbi:UNKNOWN [Stylonychia lemnae]|uniref:Uncharacterized protein n=1 Tax=Stylonychia lemnae TaxID=5949 RepID=A0A078B006_STYLE|nr:UNKNOWN [Stylonychia lemnae]|eukprot:CDW86762.1 UNKNOWN [Stylonychia lemnae]
MGSEEYKVDEKELFSEEKLAQARLSIQEKLRMISQEQQQKKEDGDIPEFEHNPANFEFTKINRTVKDVSSKKTYFYKNTLNFNKETGQGILVFQMNKDIYQTANMVDNLVAAFTLYSGFKLGSQIYFLSTLGLQGFSFFYSGLWAVLFFGQINYLTTSYLRQAFLISEIELLPNLEEVKIRTILNDKVNIFRSNKIQSEITAKISEVKYSEKDKPNSPILRVLVGDTRYYCHKNASKIQDFELLKAILTPNVSRIDYFK